MVIADSQESLATQELVDIADRELVAIVATLALAFLDIQAFRA